MKRLALIGMAMAIATEAAAGGAPQPILSQSAKTLIELWHAENTLCRGSSDEKVIEVACPRRDIYMRELEDMGWCYGKRGEAGYQMRWHRCTRASVRFDRG